MRSQTRLSIQNIDCIRIGFGVILTVLACACAPTRQLGDSASCSTYSEERARLGYLDRSLIEAQNTLAILKRIENGDIMGAQSLGEEILRSSKMEILHLQAPTATEKSRQSIRKVIDEVDRYLGSRSADQ